MATSRPLPSGKLQFIVRKKGFPQIVKTFTGDSEGKKLGEAWAAEVERQLTNGTYKDRRQENKILIKDVIAVYKEKRLKAIDKRHNTEEGKAGNKSRVNLWDKAFGKRTFETLTADVLYKFCEGRLKKVKASTLDRDLTALSDLYKAARVEFGLDVFSPIAVVKEKLEYNDLIEKTDRRSRRPSPEEIAAILAYVPPQRPRKFDIKKVAEFALETGMRRTEIASMMVEHIDLTRNIVFVPRHKTERKKKAPRYVPLSARAIEILEDVMPQVGKVWLVKPGTITQAFGRVCVRLGIEDLHLHDLRHECISRLFEAGWSIPEVAAVSGHDDWKSLRTYTDINPETIAQKMRDDEMRGQEESEANIVEFAEKVAALMAKQKAA